MKKPSIRHRLSKKNLQTLLVNHLQNRYKFAPVISEALSKDAFYLRAILQPGDRSDGQVIRYVVSLHEPAGKPLKECQYIAVKLTLNHPQDISYRQEEGIRELKLRVIKRITEEAVAQGGVLTHEDIADLLFLDRGTVSDYIIELERKGIPISTRARYTDQGRGITHRENIIKLWLMNIPEGDIANRTKHILPSVESYIEKFLRIGLCYRKGDSPSTIARITKSSAPLVEENIALYERLKADPSFRESLDKSFQFYEAGLIKRGW